jgi:hypothetical protein
MAQKFDDALVDKLVGSLKARIGRVDHSAMSKGGSDGVPAGSGRDEQIIRLGALLLVVCGGIYLTWRMATSWNAAQPVLPVLLYACELFSWAMLVSFSYLAWRVPRTDRGLIGCRQRFDVVAGVVDDVVVRVVELKSEGACLLSPRAFEPGRAVDLVAELPLEDGTTRATRLLLTVAACRPKGASRGWHISGTVVPHEDADGYALRAYDRLVAARRPLSLQGRLQGAAAASPGPRPPSEPDLEKLLAGARVTFS